MTGDLGSGQGSSCGPAAIQGESGQKPATRSISQKAAMPPIP